MHGRTSVACEKCSKKFHAEERCLGVNNTVIEALLIENSAISYNCCVCRGSSNNFNGSMGQVMGIIGSLVSDMRKVMAEISLRTGNAHSHNNSVDASNVAGHSISETASNQMPFRPGNAIMNEIREVYERDKRKNSVVIRGVMNKSEHEVKNIFNGACSYLAVGNIQISDLTKLSPSVWSGKVLDTPSRLKLLSETKRLRSSNIFKDIYIQRNLTYRQRRDLLAKRARGNNQISGANAIPITPNAPFQQTADHQAENSNETEFPNRNRNAMSEVQQNHDTHNQPPLHNGDSSRDDSSRTSRSRGRNGNRGQGRGRGGRGRGTPNPFTANHQRQPLNY